MTIVRTDLPEAGEVIAALPLLDVRGGHVVDQVFLLSELATAIAPLAHKHAGALTIFFLISLMIYCHSRAKRRWSRDQVGISYLRSFLARFLLDAAVRGVRSTVGEQAAEEQGQMRLSLCLSLCLSIFLSIYFSCLPLYFSLCFPICLSFCLSLCDHSRKARGHDQGQIKSSPLQHFNHHHNHSLY